MQCNCHLAFGFRATLRALINDHLRPRTQLNDVGLIALFLHRVFAADAHNSEWADTGKMIHGLTLQRSSSGSFRRPGTAGAWPELVVYQLRIGIRGDGHDLSSSSATMAFH
jgi:hypothetical protein